MLEYAGSQRGGLQRHRDEGLALVAVLRSIDWLLLAGVAGLVAVGLWAISGVTRFDIHSDPNYYLKRQFIYVAVGTVGLLLGLLVDPDVYRRYWRAIFGGTVGLMGEIARTLVSLSGPESVHAVEAKASFQSFPAELSNRYFPSGDQLGASKRSAAVYTTCRTVDAMVTLSNVL